jgi:glyoxylase-like metal-dependent hydrolase (beta-lactamase superfamily II)
MHPKMHPTSFRIGDMTIHRIVEMEAPFMDALDFLPGLTTELLDEHRSWLEPAALEAATRKLIFCFQSYVVRTPHHVVLIDSCIGNDKDRPTRPDWHMKTDHTYMRALAAAGIAIQDIDYVMCTHLHPDHVGWNTRLENGRWAPTFPNARYVFSKRELAFWTERNARNPIGYIVDSVLPIVAANRAELVGTDQALNDHVRLLPTPGHTPDHFAVVLGKSGPKSGPGAVVTGDLIHSPLQARYPEISCKPDYDPKQAAQTRRAFLERFCDSGTLCCTAHFPSPSVGHIVRWGDGFRCEPVAAVAG